MRFPWVMRSLLEATLAELERARLDKRIAEDRLYAAWKAEYTIPPRESVVPHERTEVKLLPEKLHAFVQNWESPETRQELEAEGRRLHYDLGLSEDRVLQLWTQRTAEPEVVT